VVADVGLPPGARGHAACGQTKRILKNVAVTSLCQYLPGNGIYSYFLLLEYYSRLSLIAPVSYDTTMYAEIGA
jgi:hypothetical protein